MGEQLQVDSGHIRQIPFLLQRRRFRDLNLKFIDLDHKVGAIFADNLGKGRHKYLNKSFPVLENLQRPKNLKDLRTVHIIKYVFRCHLIRFAGTPTTVAPSGTSLFTKLCAPTTAFSPTVTPGITVLWVPTLHFFFSTTSPTLSSIVETE